MLSSISIKGYKAINDNPGITLTHLAHVNYLVGENGSGKSSVIETLTKFDPAGNDKIRERFLMDFPIEFRIDEKIIDRYYHNNGGKKLFELHYFTGVAEGPSLSNGLSFIEGYNSVAHGFWGIPYAQSIEKLKKFNELRSILGLPPWSFTEPKSFMFGPIKLSNQSHPDISENGVLIDVNMVATGLKQIIGFQNALNNIQKHSYAVDRLVLLEEPESYMHPRYQKLIPTVLTQFPNLQFIITTHSPFIISAAAKCEDQKVYLFNNGQVKQPEGFKPSRAKYVVGEMLGAQISDLTPDKVIFVEEESVKRFLDIINIHFYNQSTIFRFPKKGLKNATGFKSVLKLSEMNEGELLYLNSFYDDSTKVYYLIDKLKASDSDYDCMKSKVEKLQKRLGENIFMVSDKYDFEDYYTADVCEKLHIGKPIANEKPEKATKVADYYIKILGREQFEKDFKDVFEKIFKS